MGDPNVDHGFLFDDQRRVDILGSPFFDVTFGDDRTADEYVVRIIYQLTLAIEDQIPAGHWFKIAQLGIEAFFVREARRKPQGVLKRDFDSRYCEFIHCVGFFFDPRDTKFGLYFGSLMMYQIYELSMGASLISEPSGGTSKLNKNGKGQDIGFHVEYVNPSGNVTLILPYRRYDSDQGNFCTILTGSYKLVWDNSYSTFLKKYLKYKVDAVPPVDPPEPVTETI
ncbi:hypothetical protein M5K25_007201 [Dendrobium thyrsiflorum]|uniref:GOLD domain-containing protein n=1 Tax=Dendrobium thyrsiflorum TaxID=117978 RepID=A0ABD0VK95_DENTH